MSQDFNPQDFNPFDPVDPVSEIGNGKRSNLTGQNKMFEIGGRPTKSNNSGKLIDTSIKQNDIPIVSIDEMKRTILERMARKFKEIKEINPDVADKIDAVAAEITGYAWPKSMKLTREMLLDAETAVHDRGLAPLDINMELSASKGKTTVHERMVEIFKKNNPEVADKLDDAAAAAAAAEIKDMKYIEKTENGFEDYALPPEAAHKITERLKSLSEVTERSAPETGEDEAAPFRRSLGLELVAGFENAPSYDELLLKSAVNAWAKVLGVSESLDPLGYKDWTTGHQCAVLGLLSDNYNQWHLKDDRGATVINLYVRSGMRNCKNPEALFDLPIDPDRGIDGPKVSDYIAEFGSAELQAKLKTWKAKQAEAPQSPNLNDSFGLFSSKPDGSGFKAKSDPKPRTP